MITDDVILDNGRARVVLRPGRGGMVTQLSVGGADVMYLDPESLADPAKNVRGGNPVLFPTPGKLAGDRWTAGALAGGMKQHGFARNLAWRVVAATGNPAPSATLELASSADTLAQFPWPFSYAITYSLRDTTLRLDMRVTNTGATALPFALGFHPYFAVPEADKAKTRIEHGATSAFDNASKQRVPAPAVIDLAVPEVDLHLLDHPSRHTALVSPARTIELHGSRDFTHWVVWTLAGKDFVCLEPWTAPGDAFNSAPDRMIVLAPGAVHDAWLDIIVT